MKKICLTVSLLVLLLLSACQGQPPAEMITGNVEIFTEDTSVLSEKISIKKGTAEDAILEACQQKKIPYTLKNNMFDNFGGISSTETEGWILYINGELAQKGAYEIMLEDSFLIEFKYVNYDSIFGEVNSF